MDERVKVIHFRRNYGQTAAMMAGFDYASGEIIIPMDGDLQNDPADIQLLLDKLEEGFDVVSGWRKDRQDNAIKRNAAVDHGEPSHLTGSAACGCTISAVR